MSKFDVGADFSAPAKVYIEHESLGVLRDENNKPGWLKVKSDKHPSLIAIHNRIKQEGIVRENNRRRGKIDNITKEEVESRSLDYLVEALEDWHLVNLAGKHIDAPCNEENKRAVLSDPNWGFLRKCLDIAMTSDEVFMPNSKLFSENTPVESSS